MALPAARPEFYVLLDGHGEMATLCCLGIDPESDELFVKAVVLEVGIADLWCFEETGFQVAEVGGRPEDGKLATTGRVSWVAAA